MRKSLLSAATAKCERLSAGNDDAAYSAALSERERCKQLSVRAAVGTGW